MTQSKSNPGKVLEKIRRTTLTAVCALVVAAPALGQSDPDNDPKTDGPSMASFKIENIKVSGSGCDNSSTTFTGRSSTSGGVDYFQAVYDAFIVKRGPDIPETNTSRNFNEIKCKIIMKINYPKGMRFKLDSAQYDGFANIIDGAIGGFRASYFFDPSSEEMGDRYAERRQFKGPVKKSYVINTKFRHKKSGEQRELWSPCKLTDAPMYFQLNTAIRLRGNREGNSMLSIDIASGVFTQKMNLHWVKCDS